MGKWCDESHEIKDPSTDLRSLCLVFLKFAKECWVHSDKNEPRTVGNYHLGFWWIRLSRYLHVQKLFWTAHGSWTKKLELLFWEDVSDLILTQSIRSIQIFYSPSIFHKINSTSHNFSNIPSWHHFLHPNVRFFNLKRLAWISLYTHVLFSKLQCLNFIRFCPASGKFFTALYLLLNLSRFLLHFFHDVESNDLASIFLQSLSKIFNRLIL